MTRKKIDRKDKTCHREFVWLAPSEYEHLCALMGKARLEEYIEELNLYIGSKGDPYVSHYYTIQTWHRRATKKAAPPVSLASLGSTADANILMNALRKNAYMPADLPKPIADRFRAMAQRDKTTWPRLHDQLKAIKLTDEEVIAAYLKTTVD